MVVDVAPHLDRAAVMAALVRLPSQGAVHVPDVLEKSFLRALQREAEATELERWPEQEGQAKQRVEGRDVPAPFATHRKICALADALTGVVNASGIRGLIGWKALEATVQRYRPGPVGITSHRDHKKSRRLVAIFTTRGSVNFRILEARHGPVISEWRVRAGDLILMRGPGLAGARDGRPFHAVSAPSHGERWSVSFRMHVAGNPYAMSSASRS